MPPDEPNDEEREEQLPEDYDTPFRPADDAQRDPDAAADDDRQVDEAKFDDTQPGTDTDIDSDELYNSGEATSSGIRPSSEGSAVVGYEPPKNTNEADEEK